MISLRGPKLKIFAGILAAIGLALSVYVSFFQSRGFEKTEAAIVDLVIETGADNDDRYYPIVEYTVDGKTYTGKLDQSSPSYKIGKSIPVLYDPNDPTVIHGGDGMGYYFIAVSALILLVVIFSAIKEKKGQRQTEALREASGFRGYAPSVQGEERELYFISDLGTAKVGHRLEDGQCRVLYEAKMTKFNALTAYAFDFIDHEHGTVTPHMVGHEEESNWDSWLIDNHYTFELDGVDVFKHLKQNGVTVDTSFGGGSGKLLGLNARILRDGVEIARAESTGRYPPEEDAAEQKTSALVPAQGFFRVWTSEQNLDLLFVTLMAFARSGAADDQGGGRGAVLGTLKNRKQSEKRKSS